ncbi:dopamine receptor D2b [Tachysurus ichikawai]
MDFLTDYGINETYRDNRSEAFNGTDVEAKHQYNYYAMLLTLLIFVIVFGNVLVCMAVSREKALQTTTNYLIVSLAVADLLVATLVMPWVVYLEVRTIFFFVSYEDDEDEERCSQGEKKE